jgi:hypothetical protein
MDPVQPVSSAQQPQPAPVFQTPEIPKGQSIVTKAHHISKLLFLVPAILIIVTLSGVAFYINRGSAPPVDQTGGGVEQPAPTEDPGANLPEATPEPTPIPQIRVVTYKSAAGAFAFDYPNNLVVYECATGIKIFKENGNYDAKADCAHDPQGVITIEYSSDEYSPGLPDSNEYQDSARIMNLGARTAILYDNTRLIDAPDKPDRIVVVISKFNDLYYRLTFRGSENNDLFTQVIDTFEFLESDVTADWTEFNDGTYKVKYPTGWAELADRDNRGNLIGGRVEFRAQEGSAVPGVVISIRTVADAELTASEVVSSTVNLDGWDGVPTVSFVSISGASAQVIEGAFEGSWSRVVVIWKSGYLVQMTWSDVIRRTNEDIIENIVSSFEFLR